MNGYPAGLVWAAIIGIGLVTYAVRVSFVVLFGRLERIPDGLERRLRFVPPAILAALFFPGLFLVQDAVVIIGNDRLIAGAVGAMVAVYTQNMFLTILVGMLALWTLAIIL